MADYHILTKGYAYHSSNKGWNANSNAVLVFSCGKNILFDPGLDKNLLLNALMKYNLSPSNIDILFISHRHIDHCYLMSLFENSDLYTGNLLIHNKQEFKHNGVITKDCTCFKTPGHTDDHASLLLITVNGNVLLAGDLFWWKTNVKQNLDIDHLINKKDIYAKDQNQLQKSRRKMLRYANIIIPGHGNSFIVINNHE